MEPRIIQLPAFTLLGLETRFIGPMSPDANNLQIIPPLFQEFFKRRSELPPTLDGFTYGACDCLPADQRTREDELIYLVSAHVPDDAPIPTGMKTWRLPARTYAHFTHRGSIQRLSETISYAHGTWLARSDFISAGGPQLERYDDRFGDGGEQSQLDYLVPVIAK